MCRFEYLSEQKGGVSKIQGPEHVGEYIHWYLKKKKCFTTSMQDLCNIEGYGSIFSNILVLFLFFHIF